MWIFLGVITKGVISMHFRVVSKGQGTELGIFFGLVVKFQFLFYLYLYKKSFASRKNERVQKWPCGATLKVILKSVSFHHHQSYLFSHFAHTCI